MSREPMLLGGCHGNVTHLILYPSPKRTGSPRTLSPEAAFVLQLSGAEITSVAPACPADRVAAWDTGEAGENRMFWFVIVIIWLGESVWGTSERYNVSVKQLQNGLKCYSFVAIYWFVGILGHASEGGSQPVKFFLKKKNQVGWERENDIV